MGGEHLEGEPEYGPAIIRRRLGRIMRRLRERAGLTMEQAASKIEYTVPSLSRLENGQQGLNIHVAKSMLDVYHESDRYEEILDLCRLSQRKAWWNSYGIHGRGYLGLESDAESARSFETHLVPGLLQSEEYARALFLGQGEEKPERIENYVRVRMIRQERLRHPTRPLTLRVVVHEAALRCRVGGLEVMYGQLAHLAVLAELPTVTLRVLPNDRGVHPSMAGGFIILTFPEQLLPDTLYVEHAFGGTDTEKEQEVNRAKLRFDQLWAMALDESATAEFLRRLAEDLE
ncbi:helix-turn-helix domain-containing protein [Amycolatopsis aidingensis]|uniref:helix-turn-helix domain-containing protein n=1 Tax=Amycolatopsis aidingensis TaxID=2842453 RepID=UPI001C0CD8A2|nr:helix-turn-helix transcriptional regulator [Amycolatopsis aidingensis]